MKSFYPWSSTQRFAEKFFIARNEKGAEKVDGREATVELLWLVVSFLEQETKKQRQAVRVK
jgi:hypothetical protein